MEEKSLNIADPRERPTKIAIVGYGNIGKGVEKAIQKNDEIYNDMVLHSIITRRPDSVLEELKKSENYEEDNFPKVISANNLEDWQNLDIDVAILCGGSKKDLPEQGPLFAKYFNTVDSFDNHKEIPKYYEDMNNVAKENSNVSIISAGWDPGTFSFERILQNAFIPGSKPQGFYGLTEKGGLSMGHSDAIRQIEGVQDARQYSHAKEDAIKRVRKGENPDLSPREIHWRECIVVAKEGYDKEDIKKKIVDMPGYFKPYETTVEFVSQEQLDEKYSDMPHDGMVISVSKTKGGNLARIEYRNIWESNPEGTAGILTASARAAHKMGSKGKKGAYAMWMVAGEEYSPYSRKELLKEFT